MTTSEKAVNSGARRGTGLALAVAGFAAVFALTPCQAISSSYSDDETHEKHGAAGARANSTAL